MVRKVVCMAISIPKGSIKRQYRVHPDDGDISFQFQKVRLKDICDNATKSGASISIPKGSIKRYKAKQRGEIRSSISIPKGSIKRGGSWPPCASRFPISIPKGSIKRVHPMRIPPHENRFQFQKVRLKVVIHPLHVDELGVFQFQKVRLKAMACVTPCSSIADFNSKRFD